jgi:hypothetical protein
MAKMTLDKLKEFITGYVNAEKSAGTWTGTVDEFTKMVDKIGSQVTLDGTFSDKLAGIFDGETLPYGKTVEEYFVDMILPVAFADGVSEEDSWDTYKPTFEDAAYSYTLGRKKLPLVTSYDTIEKVCNDGEALAGIDATIMKKFADSYTNTRYSLKEQALGNLIGKATTSMVETLAKPVDTETGEAFIESVKKQVEIASDRNEGNCLSSALIGASPKLVLIVNRGIMPSLDVNTLSGAFNQDKLSLGVEVRVVDSFGDNTDAYAVLIDPRAIQVRNSYNAIRSDMNANKDAVRTIHHFEDTVFTSKYAFAHIYKVSA